MVAPTKKQLLLKKAGDRWSPLRKQKNVGAGIARPKKSKKATAIEKCGRPTVAPKETYDDKKIGRKKAKKRRGGHCPPEKEHKKKPLLKNSGDRWSPLRKQKKCRGGHCPPEKEHKKQLRLKNAGDRWSPLRKRITIKSRL